MDQQPNTIREGFARLAIPTDTANSTVQPALPFETGAPLADPSEDELAFAFAANMFELFRAMCRLPGADLEQTPLLARHNAYPFNPMFKGAWQCRLADQDADEAIKDTVAWFEARNAPFAFWWLDPRATQADMPERLQANGFIAWEENAPAMAAGLDDLRLSIFMQRVPDGYKQERVHDERGLHDFKAAFLGGLEVPEWAGRRGSKRRRRSASSRRHGVAMWDASTTSPSPVPCCSTARGSHRYLV